jgi:predicted acyl esterase
MHFVTPHVIDGPREWTREDWRRLDECFTLERLEAPGDILGFEETSFAVVQDIQVEDVVARFIEELGGAHILATMGPGWSM